MNVVAIRSVARWGVPPAAGANRRRLLRTDKLRCDEKPDACSASGKRRAKRAQRRSLTHFLHQGPLQSHRNRRSRCFVRYGDLRSLFFWPCPAAARINTYRRPNVALRISFRCLSRFRARHHPTTSTLCWSPSSMMSTMRSEVGGRGRSVRAQEKISHSDQRGASVLSRCLLRLARSVVVIRHLCDAIASRASIKCLNRNRF